MEDMEVLNLQFAFLVTGRDLNPALNAYECLKQNTACGKYHGTGDTEDLQGDYEVVLWDDFNTPVHIEFSDTFGRFRSISDTFGRFIFIVLIQLELKSKIL